MRPSVLRAPRLALRRLAALRLVLLLSLVVVWSAVPAGAAPRRPAAPALATGIESPAASISGTSCEPYVRSGVQRLGALLSAAYPHTGYRVTRTCASPRLTEQYQGRVLTWQVSARRSKQRKQANDMLAWLMAADSAGNRLANARRLGVSVVVWNNKVWRAESASQGWKSWSNCAKRRSKRDDSRCGRSSMYVILGWAGALAKTSYWTGVVAAQDYGPCRPADLSWAYRYTAPQATRCPTYARPSARSGSSSTTRALVTWSGMHLWRGVRGKAVGAVQRRLGVKTDQRYGPSTEAAVRTWQRRHAVPVTGEADLATWRALVPASVLKTPSATDGGSVPVSTLDPAMPTTSPNGWRRVYSEDFTNPAALGSFAGTRRDDWTLDAAAPYASSLRSYPDGWGTTYDYSLNYGSQTADVVPEQLGAPGVFRLNAHTATVGGQRRSLAGSFFPVIDPAASGQAQTAQTYGRYSVRFRTIGGYAGGSSSPRYGSAFLLWPASNVWEEGEVDYPEMAWGKPIEGFVHTIGSPAKQAAHFSTGVSTEGAWHVVTIDWRPSSLVFSLDGRIVQTVTHDVPRTPFRWGFQSGGHDGTPADGVEGQLLIDWITIDAYEG